MLILNFWLQELAKYFSGDTLLPGCQTAAHCYCGHQFGAFSGQLGDGAAMYLGEVVNQKNERWEIQIKGAGPTPYSRYLIGSRGCDNRPVCVAVKDTVDGVGGLGFGYRTEHFGRSVANCLLVTFLRNSVAPTLSCGDESRHF